MVLPFNLSLRKILIAIGFIIIVIGLGFGLYFAFFKAPAQITPPVSEETTGAGTGSLPISGTALERPAGTTGAQTGTSATGGLPAAKTVQTANFALAGAEGLTISGDGVQFYDSQSGLFYSVNENGTLIPVSDKKFYQVQNVTWSGDNQKAVLEYPDGSNIVYNFATGQQTTLPKHWEDFEFSPDNSKIISKSMGDDVNNRWLVISDANGTNARAIAELGNNADKVQVAWSPSGQVVGFSATGDPTSSVGTQEIYLLGQNKENLKSLTVQGSNFQAAWAKEGDRILYSVADPANNYLPVLYAADASGDNVGTNNVKINLNTPIDKCTIISGYKAYCAVPASLPDGAGLDMRIAENTDDSFYFVNLKTGATEFIGKPDNGYDVAQISVSADEKYLYFIDTLNNGLHQMKIE